MQAFYATAVLALVAGQPAERPSVLVLDDFKLVEGQVTEIPDFRDYTGETKLYRVTSTGQIRTIPVKSVKFHGASRQEAYRFVKGDWNPSTSDGHLKLAEWCREAGLVAEALSEAKAAAAISPPDAYLAKMIRDLEAAKAKLPESSTVRIVRAAPATPVQPVAAPIKPAEKAPLDPAVEKLFGLRIQPILMNQCVSCHSDAKKGATYALSRIPEGETAGVATSRNLTATLAHVRADEPETSPILTYASKPHGGRQQPALTRHHPAYQKLFTWTVAAAAALPREQTPPKPATVAAGPLSGPATPSVAPRPIAVRDPSKPTTINFNLGPGAADMFDPAEFNKVSPPAKKP